MEAVDKLTSLLFHFLALETLVQQPNPKTDIHTHTLLIDLTSDAILDKDIGRVCSKAISTVRNLGDDLGIPLALSLAGSHEAAHNQIIDLAPVTARAGRNMSDNIRIRSFGEARLMAKRTLTDFNDVLLPALVTKIAGL
jgi:hypothetical protein